MSAHPTVRIEYRDEKGLIRWGQRHELPGFQAVIPRLAGNDHTVLSASTADMVRVAKAGTMLKKREGSEDALSILREVYRVMRGDFAEKGFTPLKIHFFGAKNKN